jgi:hypothetical protein
VDLRDELDGYTVSFTSLLEDIDATPLMKGLPDERCQCPHWGYVFKVVIINPAPAGPLVAGASRVAGLSSIRQRPWRKPVRRPVREGP